MTGKWRRQGRKFIAGGRTMYENHKKPWMRWTDLPMFPVAIRPCAVSCAGFEGHDRGKRLRLRRTRKNIQLSQIPDLLWPGTGPERFGALLDRSASRQPGKSAT